MSISDEALVYLIYENCRNVWIKMIKTGNLKKVDVKSKYTADRSGNILNNGWSREGLIRFNTYVKFVKEDRKKTGEKRLRDQFLNTLQQFSGNRSK